MGIILWKWYFQSTTCIKAFLSKTLRASSWHTICILLKKIKNLTLFLRFLTTDDLEWPQDKLRRKSNVKRLILTTFNQVGNLTFLTIFCYFWPWVTLRLFFRKILCQGLHFLTFRDFEIWPHLISNYWPSSGQTDLFEFLNPRNFLVVRQPSNRCTKSGYINLWKKSEKYDFWGFRKWTFLEKKSV